jgi:hypothetical protein
MGKENEENGKWLTIGSTGSPINLAPGEPPRSANIDNKKWTSYRSGQTGNESTLAFGGASGLG